MDERLAGAYRTLAVSPHATDEEVKQAFHKRAWTCHPDLHPGDDSLAEEFKTLEVAFSTVCTARKEAQARQSSGSPEGVPVRLHPRMTLLSEIPPGIVVWCMESALQVLENGTCMLKIDSRFWRAPRNGVRLAVLNTGTGWHVATPDRWQMQWNPVRTCSPSAVPVDRFVVGTLAASGEDVVYRFVGQPEYDSRHPGIVPAWLIERGPFRSVGK